jgi:hypothetical protein
VRAAVAPAIVVALALALPAAESTAGAPGDPGPPVAAKHRKKHKTNRCSKRRRVSRRRSSRIARRCSRRRRRHRRVQGRPRSSAHKQVPGSPLPAPGAPPLAPLSRYLSVSAREWSLTLSRPVVGAGNVTVELRNVGEDPHDLVLSPDDGSHTPLASFSETGPGQLTKLKLPLPAGRYLLWCSLPGHEALGMRTKLVAE